MNNINPLLTSDSYKYSHFNQYPEGTSEVFSYIEARGTKLPGVKEVVLFGLQKYIQDHLMHRITREEVEEAARICEQHGIPFNREGWMTVVTRHGGFLPIEVRAVPEGTPVPLSNLMVSVRNLDPDLPWLTSFVETDMLRSVWYGSTVATLSREMKRIIKYYLDATSDNAAAELPFKLHDFGCRGVSSLESAEIGGAAHLVNFMGTDTVPALMMLRRYYGADMAGFSIPASEHSTMTLRGRDGEFDSYQAMVDAYAKPNAIFACVSDSYDIYNAVRNIWCRGGLLKQVKERGATVVIRPDSGDPVATPVEVIGILMEELGDEVTVNSKGYKVLPDYVRVIQGDGIDIDDMENILIALAQKGISAANITFGMGGGLLQKVNRDTFKFAMKASSAVVNGLRVDVYKDPVTDPGKTSKRGELELYRVYKRGDLGAVPCYKTLRPDQVRRYEFGVMNDEEGNVIKPATRVVFKSYAGATQSLMMNFDEVRDNAVIL